MCQRISAAPAVLSSLLCAVGLLLSTVLFVPLASAYNGPIDNGSLRDAYPALGINETFGRWTTTVRLVYDPDNVPTRFASNTKALALIRQAADQWEQVSGVRFEVVGVDAAAPDDDALSVNRRDGLVRVHWAVTNGFAGLAGPAFGTYDQNLGYYPYYDGDVKLNQDSTTWDSDDELVSTLAHEFGHLIGLGHSENPVSIMYANPYNNLNYPREDDIRAAQALYGAGSAAIDPAAGVSTWKYSTPSAAPASVTQFLFKANDFTASDAFLSLESSPTVAITSISNATPDNKFIRLNSGGLGGFSNTTAINIAATIVLVDPGGYVWDKTPWQLTCAARSACGGGFVSSVSSETLKSYPGTWKFLVVDEAANTLLLSRTLTVSTSPVVNSAPIASVSVAAGSTSAQVRLTIAATDAEKQNITVIWHPPGSLLDRNGDGFLDTELSEPLGSDGVAVQTIDFSQVGTYTLFVELIDDGVRYDGSLAGASSAGEGFSNLLRLTVNLPLSGVAGGVSVFAQHPETTNSSSGSSGGSTTTSTQTLQTIAAARTYTTIATSGTTTAVFSIGASKDSGVTKATTFKPGDSIIAAGSVAPQAADIGKSAEIYVVIRAVLGGRESWLYRDSTGAFRPWSRFVVDLKPAVTTTSLQSGAAVEVYKGPVGTGTFDVFIGYKLTNGSVLHYTQVPMSLNVN